MASQLLKLVDHTWQKLVEALPAYRLPPGAAEQGMQDLPQPAPAHRPSDLPPLLRLTTSFWAGHDFCPDQTTTRTRRVGIREGVAGPGQLGIQVRSLDSPVPQDWVVLEDKSNGRRSRNRPVGGPSDDRSDRVDRMWQNPNEIPAAHEPGRGGYTGT